MTLGDGRCEAVVMLRPQDTTDLLKEFGPRFDQTALVRQVTVGGKTFLFEPWGLIDEFGIGGDGVLGYEQAGMGGSFLKVGVGILERNQKKPYSFWGRFPLISSAPTRVMHRDRDSLALEQSASLGEWGYRYTKRYRVEPRTATLRIEYELTNTGNSPYPVEQYNHNWLCFDHIPIGSGYTVQTAFGVDKPTKPANWLERVDGEFRLRPISKPCYLPSEQSARGRGEPHGGAIRRASGVNDDRRFPGPSFRDVDRRPSD